MLTLIFKEDAWFCSGLVETGSDWSGPAGSDAISGSITPFNSGLTDSPIKCNKQNKQNAEINY